MTGLLSNRPTKVFLPRSLIFRACSKKHTTGINTILTYWVFSLGLQDLLDPSMLHTTLNVWSAMPLGFVIKVFNDQRGRRMLPNASFWLETCHTQKPEGLFLLILIPSNSLAVFSSSIRPADQPLKSWKKPSPYSATLENKMYAWKVKSQRVLHENVQEAT